MWLAAWGVSLWFLGRRQEPGGTPCLSFGEEQVMEHRERQVPPQWLGELIRTARLRAGLRGAEGARLAGLSRQYLVRLECGQRCPSVDAAERLAAAFMMTPTERSVLLAVSVTKADGEAA